MPASQYRMGSPNVWYDYLIDGTVPNGPVKTKIITEGKPKGSKKKKTIKKK